MARPSSRSFAAESGNGYILTGLGDPIQLLGADVTANYFDTLGVKPIRGRLFLPEEEMKADVALVSASFWRKRLNSDPNVAWTQYQSEWCGDDDRRCAPEPAGHLVRT